MIPRAHALVGWNTDPVDGRITHLRVLDQRRVLAGEQPDADVWAGLSHTSGACIADWCTDGSPLHPMSLWCQLSVEAFADPDAAMSAISEFAKIEGCGWAVDALRLMGE